MVQKLRWSGRLMGLLAFHYGRPDQMQKPKYHLYKPVADQVAVANILASEAILEQKADIEQREREKSLQIEVTLLPDWI